MGTVRARLLAVAAGSAAYQLVLLTIDRSWAIALKSVVMVLVSAAMTLAAIARARREEGDRRRPAVAVSMLAAVFTLGNLIYALQAAAQHAPVPMRGLADTCMFLVGLGTPFALLSLPSAPSSRQGRIRMALDGLLTAAVLLYLAWPVLMRPIVRSGEAGTYVKLGMLGVSVEIVSIAVAILLLIGQPLRERTWLVLITTGMGVLAATGLTFALLTLHHPAWTQVGLEGGFVAGALLILLASGQPLPAAAQRRWEPATGVRGSVPYLGVAVVMLVSAVLLVRTGTLEPELTWALLGIAGLVLGRQFLTLRVNDHLMRELHDQRARLVHQASHDQLTGLANRYMLGDWLDRALARSARSGSAIALLLVDLDGFKQVNDTLGHAAGDQVLVHAAECLRAATRAGDIAARLGGDEFAVVLDAVGNADEAHTIAERVLQRLRVPVRVNGAPVPVGASIGVAVTDVTHRMNQQELFHHADLALYQAKGDGKGRVRRTWPQSVPSSAG